MIRMRQRARKQRIAEINVVPYIDVMLVLLVIFMVTAPLLTQGITVDLPEVTSKPVVTKDEPPLVVTVDKRGAVYFSASANPKKSVTEGELAKQVRMIHREFPTRPIFLKGDREVPYGDVAKVMVVLQAQGIENIGLITTTPEKKS